MTSRSVPKLLALLLLAPALASTPARAADPLLSGYAGPGGGEQAILGATLIPAKSGNGSLRAPSRVTPAAAGSSAGTPTQPATPAPAGGATPAPAASPTGQTDTATTARPGTSGSARPTDGKTTPGTAPGKSTDSPSAATPEGTAATPVAVAPAAGTPAFGDSRTSAGPLPLTRGQVVGVLAALLLLGACAAATVALTSDGTRRRA